MPENIATRWLPVPLTETELRQRGTMLASLLGDKDKVVAEAAESASSYKSRIKRLDMKVREVQTEINEKRAHRDVEVRLVPNIQDRVFEVRRVDDDTQVDLEDMTPSQFQELLNRPIPFDDEPEPATPPLTDEQRAENLVAGIEDTGVLPEEEKPDPYSFGGDFEGPDASERQEEVVSAGWLALVEFETLPNEQVETGIFVPETEGIKSLGIGYVNPDPATSEAWFHADGSPAPRFKKTKWAITHYRPIQPETN